jgi:hypothetical protein
MHYVCIGLNTCGGLSAKAGVCTTEECPRRGMPLAECNCTDGQHKAAIPPEAEKDESVPIKE